MATIEKGDYFVVRRGFELNTKALSIFGFGPEPWQQQQDDTKHYDRSYDGDLLLALDVCGDAIAAEIVSASASYHRDHLRRRVLLNAAEMELWPVTKSFADAMLAERSKP